MIDNLDILTKINQHCDVMHSDQSINNNDFFIKNRNDKNNVEDKINPEKINLSLKTISSNQIDFDKVINYIYQLMLIENFNMLN